MDEQKLRKNNFLFLTVEGSLYFTGLAFIDANAVIPVFIFAYTHSLKLAGLATTVGLACSTVAQLLLGPYVKRIRNLPSYIVLMMFLFRPLPLVMIPVLFSRLDPTAVVLVFLGLYGLLFFGDGLVMVPWSDLFGRTILAGQRGRLLGFQQLAGGVGGLAAGFLIKYLLEYPGYSSATRYSILFSCSAVALTLSAAAMLPARDLPHTVTARPASNWHYYAQLPASLAKSREFRRLVLVRVLSGVTNMVAPFLILFGQKTLGLDNNQVSTLVYVQIAGSLVGGLIWGQISSRHGNKYVILSAQLVGLLICATSLSCLLLGPGHFPWIALWPLVLANGANMGSWLGSLNYTIDIIPEDERTVYLLLSSLIALPLTGLTFLAGFIAESAGFAPLFIAGAISASCGLLAARRLKSPRQLADLANPK
jgi:MFS family permease